MAKPWTVCVHAETLDDFDPEEIPADIDEGEFDYEVSVMHDAHDMKASWGWSGLNKIIIDNGRESKSQAIHLANLLCDALNKETI